MIAGILTTSWIAGSIVAAVAGVVGFFVVLRGASFAAHALPLGAFPAVAAAHLLGLDPLGTALIFALAGAATISAMGQGTRRDVASAIWLVLMLAVGEMLLSRMQAYGRAVYGLLFGQLLGVTPADLHLIAGVGILAALLILLTFRPLLLSTLAPELAVAAGVPPRLVEFLFLALLALASSAALPAVGALLCFSLMVGPASAARHLFDRPTAALAASVALSLLTVWGALLLSSATGWPVGLYVGVGGLVLYLAPRARAVRGHARAPEPRS